MQSSSPPPAFLPEDTGRRSCLSFVACAALGLGIAAAAPHSAAQPFPSRPIQILIAASSGTTSDILARILSAPMEKFLGQPVVVEAVPGAGGITATDRLVRAPKDGHTLVMASNNHVINPAIYKKMPFDSIADIAPISVVGSTPAIILMHPSVPAKNARELIALAKAKPGELNYGSGGNGSALHLAGVMFVSEASVDIKHVPYKGFAPMLTDLLGGQIQLGVGGVAPVAEHVRSGRLRALGVTTRERSTILPDVPTLAEAGLPNYQFDAWLALIAAAGTPQPVIDRLHDAIRQSLALPEVQKAFAAQGVSIVGSAPADAARFFKSELHKHAELVKRSGAVLE